MTANPNKSIECTVDQCLHHCGGENYCSLNKIKVQTHETNPTKIECTDCASFEMKQFQLRRSRNKKDVPKCGTSFLIIFSKEKLLIYYNTDYQLIGVFRNVKGSADASFSY